MLLVIDIGNSRTKWALAGDSGVLTEFEVCMNANIASSNLSAAAQKADNTLIANVAGEAMAQQIGRLLPPLTLKFLTASQQACGVTNNYLMPSKLGADRWAALIAAWQRTKHAAIVVNAGTAITIDAIDEKGAFLGGSIMPGLRLMHESLVINAAQLNVEEGVLQNFPINTQDAITSGSLNAVAGAISLMLKRLEKQCGWLPKLVLSGGDANKIAEALKLNLKQVIMMENIVLQGLVLLAKQ
ncbi:MAG: type III pantothenate kinase [Bdellovibrio sp.]|nr:type III pantothenate kinase [Methylotenera sp.]